MMLLQRAGRAGRAGEPRLGGGRRLAGTLTRALLKLIPPRQHRDRAGRHGRRARRRVVRLVLAERGRMHAATGLARSATRACLHGAMIFDDTDRAGEKITGVLSGGVRVGARHTLRTGRALLLSALLRCLLLLRTRGLRRVALAHHRGEVERFHLRRLIPGMLAGGALQRSALLA
jgi:hypothetical protein